MNDSTVLKTRKLDLCVSCEICLAVCPVEAISMEFFNGKYVPKIDLDVCIECNKCLENCPGIDLLPLPVVNESILDEMIKGKMLESYTAFSKNEKIRITSTSGGIITTLVRELIEVKEYQKVFVLKFEKFEKKPVRLEETNNLNDIVKSAKSKYLPASVYNIIAKIKEDENSKLIIIGTPCQILGIKKFLRCKNINENNLLFLGLFCSSTLNFNFLQFVEDSYSKHSEITTEFLYRTKERYGWPGHSKITFNSGRSKILDREIRANLKKYFGLNRCLYCYDKANKYSDIVFGDCYIKNKQNSKGKSTIIVRTEKGKDILEKYSYLFHIEKEAVEEIWESQNIQDEKNHLIYSLILAQKEELYSELNSDFQVKLSDKSQLKYLQKNLKLGTDYRKRKIKLRLNQALYVQSIKRLLLILVEKVGKFFLPPLILIKGYLIHRKKESSNQNIKRNNVIILGGKFFNEGAQAMSLIALDQFRRRNNQLELYHFTNSSLDMYNDKKKHYKVEILPWTINEKFSILGRPFNFISRSSLFTNLTPKTITILKNSKFIVDLSGFAISSEIREYVWIPFLINLFLAKQYSIPFYIFPQAIGPFAFKLSERIFLYPLLKWYLKYPTVIFCREINSYQSVRMFTKKNVQISPDIVLQHRIKDFNNVFQEDLKFKDFNIKRNSIGIVPNARVLKRANKDYIDSLYQIIIKSLLDSKKNIYLLYNSFEDLSYCLKLKKFFPHNENVLVISDQLNSIELENLTKKFDFVVTSRYHSVIQAYKNAVPAIVIGWASKYLELVSLFGQKSYYFDIRENPSSEEILEKLSLILINRNTESDKIESKMREIRKLRSPFAIFDKLL